MFGDDLVDVVVFGLLNGDDEELVGHEEGPHGVLGLLNAHQQPLLQLKAGQVRRLVKRVDVRLRKHLSRRKQRDARFRQLVHAAQLSDQLELQRHLRLVNALDHLNLMAVCLGWAWSLLLNYNAV